jgi:hypothetical protein
MEFFLLEITLEKEYIICSAVAFHFKSQQLLLRVPYLNKAIVFDKLYDIYFYFSQKSGIHERQFS